jgi:hypothetical protein
VHHWWAQKKSEYMRCIHKQDRVNPEISHPVKMFKVKDMMTALFRKIHQKILLKVHQKLHLVELLHSRLP